LPIGTARNGAIMRNISALPPTLPPRLINREAAAAYVNVSPSKFDELVRDGRMPRPRCIDRRKAWDTRQLDAAIDDLPFDGGDSDRNPWDA
jgi:predicted DNA-binding transcriptional regulator AlpA